MVSASEFEQLAPGTAITLPDHGMGYVLEDHPDRDLLRAQLQGAGGDVGVVRSMCLVHMLGDEPLVLSEKGRASLEG